MSNLICRVVKAHEVLTASKDATSIFGGRENAKNKNDLVIHIPNSLELARGLLRVRGERVPVRSRIEVRLAEVPADGRQQQQAYVC